MNARLQFESAAEEGESWKAELGLGTLSQQSSCCITSTMGPQQQIKSPNASSSPSLISA